MTDINGTFAYAGPRRDRFLAEVNEKNEASLFGLLAANAITCLHVSFNPHSPDETTILSPSEAVLG